MAVVVTYDGTPCALFDLPVLDPRPGPAWRSRRSPGGRPATAITGGSSSFSAAASAFPARITSAPRARGMHASTAPPARRAVHRARGARPGPGRGRDRGQRSGDHDCRAEAQRAGARYVREDRRGLDNARNAGLRAARGEIVAFTDDDCRPAVGWLRSLPELFGDPTVATVTGPAFAYSVSTEAQRQFETSGGFGRGLRRRHFDWANLPPTDSGRAGAGANMIFRASVLRELGDPFRPSSTRQPPTESEATCTRSTGFSRRAGGSCTTPATDVSTSTGRIRSRCGAPSAATEGDLGGPHEAPARGARSRHAG